MVNLAGEIRRRSRIRQEPCLITTCELCINDRACINLTNPQSTNMLLRVLEAEVMESEADAADYDAMDFANVNAAFVSDFLTQFTPTFRHSDSPTFGLSLLDIGTGTARIPIEMAKRSPNVRIVAVDLSAHMLAVGKRNVERAELTHRISLERVDAKGMPFADGSFDAVVSNSIVHHIPEPSAFFREAVRLVAPGGLLFVRDLFRPSDRATLDRLVEMYAGNETPHQRQLFADSLHAALTVEDVRSLVASLGFSPSTVSATSDRHWTWIGRKVGVSERPKVGESR